MDLLKSCFFLLSGYQERNNLKPDSSGRFEFDSSIQYRINFLDRPLVNYYFEELIRGIEKYCSIHKIECRRKKPFKNFCFFLTHDVDRIRYFNLNSYLYTIKQLTGLAKSERNKLWLIRELFRIEFNMLTLNRNKDPYWNFEYLAGLEKEYGIHSTWFFLPKDRKHVDSYYNFSDRRIRSLISYLIGRGHEAGLHGTVRSHFSYEALKTIKDQLRNAAGKEIHGIRQHRLMWDHSVTAHIQESAGFEYDSTLGFAGHEGFRNGYCFPFRLFDFENNRMMSTWEIPLNIMESTLFEYRKLSYEDSKSAIFSLINEIKKFNGTFTLLWHNSYLHEEMRPGINKFYSEVLKTIMEENPESLNGIDIIKRMNEQ
jgi:peptidoglycan/xylan/chitin deacetylase (PgdA/CDA1 family)